MASSKARSLDEEIAGVTARIAEVERVGPALQELEAARVETLHRAVASFQRHGLPFQQGTLTLPQLLEVLAGAIMTAAPEKITEAELQRLRTQFKAGGNRGMTQEQKAEELTTLRAEQRRLFAKREQAWREREGRGEQIERVGGDPETFLARDVDLTAIAEGRM